MTASGAVPGDYHVHTTWSDGGGGVEACVVRAVELGLPEIGIADHVSTAAGPGEDWWLPLERLGAYCEDVRAVASRHPEITVLLGLEAEYLDGGEAELDALLDAWPFDLVVLGVHVVDGFDFDDPSRRADPRWDDPDALLAAYYRVVRRAAEINQGPVALAGNMGPEGFLPLSGSLLHVNPPTVVAQVLKQAEDGDGLVIRLYESSGEAAQATIHLPHLGRKFAARFAPSEIKTYLLPHNLALPEREVNILEWSDRGTP